MLVDCTRGVTADDTAFMERLDRAEKPFHVIVTKADLLAPETLAQSYELIRADIEPRHPSYAGGDMPMTSAHNHAGMNELLARLHAAVLTTYGRGADAADADAEDDDADEDDDEDDAADRARDAG